MTETTTRLRPIVALKALRRLIADPEQTHEVFTILRALSGPSLRHGFMRFASTSTGRKVLSERRDLLSTLQDRQRLEQLPPASLGRRYWEWTRSEALSADGLVTASAQMDYAEFGPDMALFAMRQRDMHDLWHTVTQYGRDELGEACLLAFTAAQTRNFAIALITLAGCGKLSRIYGLDVFRSAWRAYRDGRRAAWLPAQDWESLLTLPIDQVRQQLGIVEPFRYWALRAPATAPA